MYSWYYHLQPENIVLKEKDGKQLKIIDFGTAQDLSVNPKIKSMVGTPEFIGKSIAPSHNLSIYRMHSS